MNRIAIKPELKALIFNALRLDRDETKRDLQQPNVAPHTKELLTQKLAELNKVLDAMAPYKPVNAVSPEVKDAVDSALYAIADRCSTPVKTFPEGGIVGGKPGFRDYQVKLARELAEVTNGKTITIDTGRSDAGYNLIWLRSSVVNTGLLTPEEATDAIMGSEPLKETAALEAIAIKQMERILKGAANYEEEETIAAKGLNITGYNGKWQNAKRFVAEHNRNGYTPAEYWHKVRLHFLEIGGEYIGQRCKGAEASTKQPECYIGGFSVPITEALSFSFIEASPEATAFLEQLEGCIIESIDYAGNGFFDRYGNLGEYLPAEKMYKNRIQYYQAGSTKNFVF